MKKNTHLVKWTEDTFEKWEEEFRKDHPFSHWFDKFIFKGKSFCGYSPHHSFFRPWLIVEYCCREFYWAYQRIFRGWDNRVVWSIDWYLAEKIPLWIQRLKETKHGVPFSMFTDDQLSSPNGISNESTDIASIKWNVVLDKIILGFESYIKFKDMYDIHSDEYIQLDKDFKIGFNLFKKHFGDLWD